MKEELDKLLQEQCAKDTKKAGNEGDNDETNVKKEAEDDTTTNVKEEATVN